MSVCRIEESVSCDNSIATFCGFEPFLEVTGSSDICSKDLQYFCQFYVVQSQNPENKVDASEADFGAGLCR